jgi:hypothetical protein
MSPPAPARYADAMLANIWHWWIGVVMTGVAFLATLSLVVGYLRNVTAPQYPGRRNRDEE